MLINTVAAATRSCSSSNRACQ